MALVRRASEPPKQRKKRRVSEAEKAKRLEAKRPARRGEEAAGEGGWGVRRREGWERRRLLLLLGATAVSLGLLGPVDTSPTFMAGRSLAHWQAPGMLPVTVALLATLLDQAEALKRHVAATIQESGRSLLPCFGDKMNYVSM